MGLCFLKKKKKKNNFCDSYTFLRTRICAHIKLAHLLKQKRRLLHSADDINIRDEHHAPVFWIGSLVDCCLSCTRAIEIRDIVATRLYYPPVQPRVISQPERRKCAFSRFAYALSCLDSKAATRSLTEGFVIFRNYIASTPKDTIINRIERARAQKDSAGIFKPFRRRVKTHFSRGQVLASVVKDPSFLWINFSGHQGYGLPGPITDGFEHNYGELDALFNEWLDYDSVPKGTLQQMVYVANSLCDPFYDAYTDR